MKKILLALAAVVLIGAGAFGFYVWNESRGIAPGLLEEKYLTPADRFVEVAGLRVRVREEGAAGAPPLLLLHGFTYSLESWDGWATALSGDYRVIRFDLAGHGLTGPDPQKRYSPAERAAFIGDFMDAIGVESAYLGGNSLGGLAAWRFAADNPERVSALLLVSPGAYSTNGVSDTPLSPPPAMAAYLRMAPEAGVRASAGYVFADETKITEARLALLRDMMRRRGNGEAFIESIEEFVLPDPTEDLAKIAAPTLILWGDRDMVIPVEQAARLARDIEGAEIIIYEGVGHAAQEEAPARSVADAAAFLNALAAGPN